MLTGVCDKYGAGHRLIAGQAIGGFVSSDPLDFTYQKEPCVIQTWSWPDSNLDGRLTQQSSPQQFYCVDNPAPSIGGILPVAYASSTCGASHCPNVPPSGSTMLARNSLSSVVMPDSTASNLALSMTG